jgi:hypothetical protein
VLARIKSAAEEHAVITDDQVVEWIRHQSQR